MKSSRSDSPTGHSELSLTIRNLGKQYRRDFWGLRDFSLELKPGILGLLGPNGAGKSTLMRILATITRPTQGEVLWNGGDIVKFPDAIRSVLGYLPQDFGVYPNLTAIEFLEYMAAIKGVGAAQSHRRIEEVLELVNLRDAARRPLGGYSGGMKQRVGIAQALLNDPQLLIVDEPTVGLDPEERVRFRSLLADLSGERIIILSTHIVSDVEAAASDIAIIQRGQLLAHCPPEEMLHQLDGKVWEWIVPSSEVPQLKQQMLLTGTVRRNEGVQVRVVHDDQPHPMAQMVSPSLEDVYLSYVQRPSQPALVSGG